MPLDAREILLYLTLKYENNWDKIYEILKSKSDIDMDEAERVVDEYCGEFVTILDKEYPDLLKHTYKPPFVLLIQ